VISLFWFFLGLLVWLMLAFFVSAFSGVHDMDLSTITISFQDFTYMFIVVLAAQAVNYGVNKLLDLFNFR